jgi:hypothetical protein
MFVGSPTGTFVLPVSRAESSVITASGDDGSDGTTDLPIQFYISITFLAHPVEIKKKGPRKLCAFKSPIELRVSFISPRYWGGYQQHVFHFICKLLAQ